MIQMVLKKIFFLQISFINYFFFSNNKINKYKDNKESIIDDKEVIDDTDGLKKKFFFINFFY
jgi:hypothetical protein